jgi:hypothetical protein
MRRPEPTEQELRLAWTHCTGRARSPWPATFEEAMAHPTLSRLVRITAMHPPRVIVQWGSAIGKTTSLPLRRMTPDHFDRKRAAAGDRDD